MKVLLRFRRAGSAFLALVFLELFLSVPAAALSPVDRNRRGSITVDLSGSGGAGTSVSGIEFTVYKVADLLLSGGYGLTGAFLGSGLRLDRLVTASDASTAAKNLVGYISTNQIGGTSDVTNTGGIVKFSGLDLGYYLVVKDDAAGQVVCDPFLLAVPMESFDGKNWVYDIVAKPKTEAEIKSGAVILQKRNRSETPLSGAVFRLDRKFYYDSSLVSPPPGAFQTGTDSGGTYYWIISVSELVTNRHGQIAVKGMPILDDKGRSVRYRFIELAAPSGYRLDSTPREFSISAAGSVTVVDGGLYVVESGNVQTITVYNDRPPHDDSSNPRSTPSRPSSSSTPSEVSEPSVPTSSPSSGPEPIPEDGVPGSGFNLPKTGGSIAYAVCTFGGISLMLCGAAVFVLSRKKRG